jgi:oligogalacturonide lyase
VIAVNTDGSGHRVVREPPRAVGHVQVCPVDPDLILYSSDVNQRMWLVRVDGSGERPLYLHDKREWITHESFLGQSDEVIFAHWPFALKAIRVGEREVRVVADFNAWHASSSPDGSWIVCDTTCPDIGLQLIDPATGEHRPLCYPQSSNGGTQWAETVPADDDQVEADTYGPQWSHPHPSFSPDGRQVVYTSDRTGISQVYVVDVPT